MTFFVIFRKVEFIFFPNLKFLTLLLCAVRVLSGVLILASKYDCSNLFSFRDIMFFVIFHKISENLTIFSSIFFCFFFDIFSYSMFFWFFNPFSIFFQSFFFLIFYLFFFNPCFSSFFLSFFNQFDVFF